MNGEHEDNQGSTTDLLGDTQTEKTTGNQTEPPIVTQTTIKDEPEEADEVDALVEANKGNFLPVLYMIQNKQHIDLTSLDEGGYGIVHYAVCFANFQVLFCKTDFESLAGL